MNDIKKVIFDALSQGEAPCMDTDAVIHALDAAGYVIVPKGSPPAARNSKNLRNAAIINMRNNGAIYKDIAAEFGITVNRARQIAIRGGCDLVISCPARDKQSR